MAGDVEYLWRVTQWDTFPARYRVESRTAKTYQVHEDSQFGWENRVRESSIGKEWFRTEREAWQAKLKRATQAVLDAKKQLQEERSTLGQVESQMRKRCWL